MPSNCCVPLCKCPHSGYHFPREEELCLKWRLAIRRQDANGELWMPTANSRVCKSHFTQDDFRQSEFGEGLRKWLKAGAIPSIFPYDASSSAGATTKRKRRSQQKQQPPPPLPCKFPSGKVRGIKTVASDAVVAAAAAAAAAKDAFLLLPPRQLIKTEPMECVETVWEPQEDDYGTTGNAAALHVNNSFMAKSVGIQSVPKRSSVATQCDLLSRNAMFGVQRFEADARAVRFYSGFPNYQHFARFFRLMLGSAAYRLDYRSDVISEQDELFLTLMKLRQATDDFELSLLFGVCEASVAKIVDAWVNFMHFRFKEVDIWPSKDDVAVAATETPAAKKIVHVETPSSLGKTFKILRELRQATACSASKVKTMTFVCFMLSNFCKSVIVNRVA